MVRNVASIAFKKSRDKQSGKRKLIKGVSFLLKEVFIASAKGVSSVASKEEWGAIEENNLILQIRLLGYVKYMVGREFSENIDEGSYKKGLRR